MRTKNSIQDMIVNNVLKTASIPKYSEFFRIRPFGLGTDRSESFVSYITVLSGCHSHDIFTFFTYALSRYGDIKAATMRHIHNSRRLNFSNLNLSNRASEPALAACSAFEEMTVRNDLRYLMIDSLPYIFPHKEIFRQFRAWCPECLGEMQQTGDVHELLIWSLVEAKICLKHLKYLANLCPKCNRPQRLLSKKFIPGYCNKCRSWLGDAISAECTDNLDWHIWVTRELGDFIAHQPLRPPMRHIYFVLKIMRSCLSGVGINYKTLRLFSRPNHLPHFSNFLQLLKFTKTSLLSILPLVEIKASRSKKRITIIGEAPKLLPKKSASMDDVSSHKEDDRVDAPAV
jgi:hypothetical protein